MQKLNLSVGNREKILQILQTLTRYASNISLAFQITDDVLDVTGTQAELGKTPGKDLQVQKAIYPSLWGIEESKLKAQQLVEQAKAELACFGDLAIPLVAIADFITKRKC